MNDVTNYLEEQMNRHFELGDKKKGAIYKEAFISAFRMHTIDATIRHIGDRLDAMEDAVKDVNQKVSKVEMMLDGLEQIKEDKKPLSERVADFIKSTLDSHGINGVDFFSNAQSEQYIQLLSEIIELEEYTK